MLMEKEIKRLFDQLVHQDIAQVLMDGNDITIRILDNASKLSLSTPVYCGGNFIPISVRKSLKQNPFKSSFVNPSLHIDEGKFQIDMRFVGHFENMNSKRFIDLLEEFSFLAGEWRLFLDEHDKNDLVHVRVK